MIDNSTPLTASRASHEAAAPAKPSTVTNWLPIAGAPRDGRSVLLRFGQDGVSQAKYIPGLPHPWQFIDTQDGITWVLNHAVDGAGGPSHWQPLPDASMGAPSVAAARPGPVTQTWVHAIPMMQQSVLLAAIRGPDGQPKYGGGAKMLLRWYRRCVLLSAMDGKVLGNPIDENGGSFTGPSLNGHDELEPWPERMQLHVHDYLRQVDMLPHHYQMHFMHAAEIVGFKHPNHEIRHFWHRLYLRLVNDFHLWPETEEQLDDRLGDTRSGWLKRADPATAA